VLDSGAEGPGFKSQPLRRRVVGGGLDTPLRHGKVNTAWRATSPAKPCRSGNSRRQTVHTNRASVHQAVKLAAAILRVARVTAGLAESNGSLPPGL